MSRAIVALALVIGGAATYAWLQKNGDAKDMQSQAEGAVNKVRSAFSNDDTADNAIAQVRDTGNKLVEDAADRIEEATA